MVASSELLFTLAISVGGEAAGVTGAVPDEEGASPGGDKGGVGGGDHGLLDGAVAETGICAIVLLKWKEN